MATGWGPELGSSEPSKVIVSFSEGPDGDGG